MRLKYKICCGFLRYLTIGVIVVTAGMHFFKLYQGFDKIVFFYVIKFTGKNFKYVHVLEYYTYFKYYLFYMVDEN